MAKIGKFILADPAGTYLRPLLHPNDIEKSPTTILLKQLRLSAGDYVGLLQTGSFSASPTLPGITSMVGLFRNGTKRLVPMSFGLEFFETTIVSDIPEDFSIWDEQIIVRVPKKADRLELTPNDEFFRDNINDDSYGVLITKPNSSPSKSDLENSDGADHDDSTYDEEPTPSLLALLAYVSNQPESKTAQKRRMSPVPNPQYRGWFPPSKKWPVAHWTPRQSKYNPKGRKGRRHHGVDIFAPQGSKILAPISGRFIRNGYRQNGTFGRNGVIVYRSRKSARHCILAHLSSVTAPNGRIKAGAEVGLAGCTGNAGKDCGLGKQNKFGGRTDHVHLEVRIGKKPANKLKRVNPVREFRLKIKTPR